MEFDISRLITAEAEVKQLRKENQLVVNELNILHAQVQVITEWVRKHFGVELFKTNSFVFKYLDKREDIEEIASTIRFPLPSYRRSWTEFNATTPSSTKPSFQPSDSLRFTSRNSNENESSPRPPVSIQTTPVTSRAVASDTRTQTTNSEFRAQGVTYTYSTPVHTSTAPPTLKSRNERPQTQTSSVQTATTTTITPETITVVNAPEDKNDSGIVEDADVEIDTTQQYYIVDLEMPSAATGRDSPSIVEIVNQPEGETEGSTHRIKSKTVTVKPASPKKKRALKRSNQKFREVRKARKSTKDKTQKTLVSCDLCGKSVKLEGLPDHMLLHSGKYFECEECGAKIYREYNYKLHMDRHRKEGKQFKCDTCEKSFLSRRELKIHSAYHKEGRPFRCNQCDATYPTSHRLKVHLVTHTGEQHYVCSYCGKSFSYKTSWYLHEKLHANRGLKARSESVSSPEPGPSSRS